MDFKGRLGYVVPFCNSSCRAETVPQHFSGLLGIKSRQIFTLILAQLHILTSLQMSGIPTLTKVVSTHLTPNRGYHRSHCQMTGRTSKKPEPPQAVISQGSQQPPLATVCKAVIHLIFWELFQLVTFLILIFRTRQDPRFLALFFSNCKV